MRILIIGNGIAGITAAITIRKLADHEITVISAETTHFYARTALMYLYLGQLKFEHIKGYEDWFWKENKIDILQATVNGVDLKGKIVLLDNGENLPYDKLILATGSKTNFDNWPNQELKGIHGFYSVQDLEQIEIATAQCREAVIIGGGLIGIELAEMLHLRNIKVTMLIRDNWYWGKNLPEPEARLVEKELQKNGIAYHLKTTTRHFEADENNQVCAVVTSSNEHLPCTFVGIATGVKPNLDLALTTELKVNRGILVNEYLQTSNPDIYAIGDCAELTFADNTIEQLWYTGRMQGETVAHTICGNKTNYNRGIPFNSAKFFSLEFQSYGLVNPALQENAGSFFWQHPQKSISIRINYDLVADQPVTGFVLMGTRFRQNVCETWIREKRPLTYTLNHLEKAFFDPEFEPKNKNAILKHFKTQHPDFEFQKPATRFLPWL